MESLHETHKVMLHSSPGKTLDCAIETVVEWDGETIGVSVPALVYDKERGIGPVFYCAIDGDKFVVRIGHTEDCSWTFEWSESGQKWYPRERPQEWHI